MVRYTVRENFFRLGEDNTINHEDGTPAFRVDGRALSLRDHMDIYDMQGNVVGAVQRKLVSMLPQSRSSFPVASRPCCTRNSPS